MQVLKSLEVEKLRHKSEKLRHSQKKGKTAGKFKSLGKNMKEPPKLQDFPVTPV